MKNLKRANKGNDTVITFEPVFRMLSNELAKIDESLELVCAGGYVMQLYGYRGTSDIDAFYKSNAAIDGAIRKVGDDLGINKPDELWLNNSISNMNPEPADKYIQVVHQYSKAGFARNPTRLGEARFPSPHADDVRAPRCSRGD
ncbi:MAG: hypothetical protein FWH55_09965 [Oscillospiraceae bacterium]|nr:hypothetical protein [Oscillospiraceae bacterium]